MKRLSYIPSIIILLLSACSTYQMNTVRSTNTTRDENTGDFKLENDSVKIVYSFTGENAPIHIDISNKLNEPVYIDWERSAFITGGKSYSYADQTVQITGDVSGAAVSVDKNLSFSNSYINAQAVLPKNVVFVPPHSLVTKTVSIMGKQSLQYVSESYFTKVKLSSSYDNSPQNVKLAKFDLANSPLVFKSYLTLYTLNQNTPKFITYQNDFYVSEVVRASSGPENFSFYQNGRGDLFTSSGSANEK